MKYLYHAKKAGTKVVTVNSYREPGMEKYWVPSSVESAVFGTKITDRFFLVNVGGDIAFLNGTLKVMLANGWINQDFVANHTVGFDQVRAALDAQSFEELEAQAGVPRSEMEAFARMLGEARTAVLVWSMGITQHEFGEDNVRAIINLGLTKGFVGRDKCGLMPIRGHSGVQGGAEMGAYATVLPGGLALDDENTGKFTALWGFKVDKVEGLTAPQMLEAAHVANLDVLISSGGNFREVLPDPAYVDEAMARIPLRVHIDIVLSGQTLTDPADTVVLLPAATRYEMPGGVTRDLDRAASHLQSRDPRPAHRRGPPGVGDLRRAGQARAERLGLASGDPVVLRSDHGEFRGRALVAPVTPGNLQVHWPEAEGLIDRRRRSPQAGIPDYNAVVTLEKLAAGDGIPHPSDGALPASS